MYSKKFILFCVCLLAGVLSAQAQLVVNAGTYKRICPGTQVVLGGNPTAHGGQKPYSYVWAPTTSLNYPDSANPIASPTTTTIYTVTVRDGVGGVAKDTVTIYVYPYYVYAGRDTTIYEGQTITLHGQAPGDSISWWSPNGSIYNQNTLNPDVFPTATTSYTLVAVFPHGCTYYTNLTVKVIPNSELYFYNSFSPNGDGANDYFYIGNISQYPNNTLEIYNRYGQKIYSVTGYNNDWTGSYLGTDLPSGTYFYILDTHEKPGKFKGEVNIIR
ncbi:MAG TPA: gliding motility-associated C-terminal domain-containing protein [Bacteroidia bacterium]